MPIGFPKMFLKSGSRSETCPTCERPLELTAEGQDVCSICGPTGPVPAPVSVEEAWKNRNASKHAVRSERVELQLQQVRDQEARQLRTEALLREKMKLTGAAVHPVASAMGKAATKEWAASEEQPAADAAASEKVSKRAKVRTE